MALAVGMCRGGGEDGGVELAVRLFAHGGSAVVARRLAAGAAGEPPRTVGIDAIVR